MTDVLKIKTDVNVVFKKIDKLVKTKISNISSKTAKGDVPTNLWLGRNPRQMRSLISWKMVLKNNLSLKHLESFENGVCVEFVNEDFLQSQIPSENKELFEELKSRVGSDEDISSIICFRTDDKDPGANSARTAYDNFMNSSNKIKLEPIKRIDLDLYKERYKIHLGKEFTHKSNDRDAIGNWAWEGNSFVDIKGGKQGKIQTVENKEKLFNPAIEFATKKCIEDIHIVLVFFFLHAEGLDEYATCEEIENLKLRCSNYLKTRDYDDGNLYTYCTDHKCLRIKAGTLMDPIDVKEIKAIDFSHQRTESDEFIIDLAHNESQSKKIFKYDKVNNFLVSAARPTNLFWAKKASNMIQQNDTLDEFILKERNRVERRNEIDYTLKWFLQRERDRVKRRK